MKNRRAYSVDLYFKNLLHRLFDLRLGGVHGHLKDNGVLRLFHAQSLFRDDGPANHFVNVDVHGLCPRALFFILGFVFNLSF